MYIYNFQQDRRFVGIELVLGEAACSDLKECLGLENDLEFGQLMQNPLESMKQEWLKNGSKTDIANYIYVTTGTACAAEDIPEHVKQTFLLGVYHGGTIVKADYDIRHDNMVLQDFVNHDISNTAGLKAHHCASLRLYTSDSFTLFNRPIRSGTTPHPIRVTMYVLDEALKKLRKVEAKHDRKAYAATMYLWRGMKDMHMNVDDFKECGGTEVYTHTHTHTQTHTQTHTHTNTLTYIHTITQNTSTHTHAQIHTRILCHIYSDQHIQTHARTYTYTHTHSHACTHTYIHTRTHTKTHAHTLYYCDIVIYIQS